MSTVTLRYVLTGAMLVAITSSTADHASAQCATCPAPTVAYSPVVAQPVIAQPTIAYRPYTGWYPGKWFDQMRIRRAARRTTAYAPTYAAAYPPAYTAAYAPTYTASYAPTYTAGYAPVVRTAAYRPYVTSYAPLSAPTISSCNTCVQTVARPVLMRPVVAAPVCSSCSVAPSCGSSGCDPCGCSSGACSTGACSTGVSQAVYSDTSACSSCAAGGTVTNVVPPNSGAASVGPATTQPDFSPVPEPADSQYRQKPEVNGGSADPLDKYDPGPATESGSSTYHNAPRLLDPHDRTAIRTYKSRKPTVDVTNAVYRQQVSRPSVRQTSTRARTQAEIDAQGWTAVPSNR